MRARGVLPTLCGIEYAAQAMAVHGGLTGAVHGKPSAGYLASVRDVGWHAERLDNAGVLVVEADLLSVNDLSVMYRFALRVDDTLMLEGRATVILEVAAQAR
jgi:predicted hotdog family 3-hydroxylacyl-ACP dehydratase